MFFDVRWCSLIVFDVTDFLWLSLMLFPVLSCSFIFFLFRSVSFMSFRFHSCSFIFVHVLSCSFMLGHALSCSFNIFHYLSFYFPPPPPPSVAVLGGGGDRSLGLVLWIMQVLMVGDHKPPQNLRKSHWCVPFTATFSKRRKIGASWSERCDTYRSQRKKISQPTARWQYLNSTDADNKLHPWTLQTCRTNTCMLIKYTLPLSHIAPQSSFHQKRKLWPFQLWAMQAHHHGLVLGLFCPRMSSEITVEVILCKYSRQSVKPEIPVCIAVAIPWL